MSPTTFTSSCKFIFPGVEDDKNLIDTWSNPLSSKLEHQQQHHNEFNFMSFQSTVHDHVFPRSANASENILKMFLSANIPGIIIISTLC